MKVVTEERTPTRLACIRHIGPYHEIGKAFAELGQKLASAGILEDQLGQIVAVYYDDPNTTAPSDLKSDAGIIVAESVDLPPTLIEQRLAGGRYAVAAHEGSYAGLGEAWSRLYREELPANGLQWLDAPCFEIYRNDCTKVPEAELRTDLYVPIRA